MRLPLPIDAVLPELLAKLNAAGAVVLRAPTGAGKTTRVPPAVVTAAGEVILVEPRRVAARAAARRMAFEDGTRLGDRIGYAVRFDRCAGPATRVLAVTPGILLRRLMTDPFLESVATVIFDEFHERGLESDLALGMVKLIRESVRPELRVIVMSATLEGERISKYLGECPIVASEGRLHPVSVRYSPRRSGVEVTDAVAAAVHEVLARTPGDVLAFLPGLREIRRTAEMLAGIDAEVLPLHGDLPPEVQDRALQKLPHRKVVLATNVAEASVTVDGVTAVIDSGLARQLEFDASIGMDRLVLAGISQASSEQRAGRAGRTQPGECVRLWDESSHRGRPAEIVPEIRRVDVCASILQMRRFGERAVTAFPWLDAPQPTTVAQAEQLLARLGAVENGELTKLGAAMALLPVPPRAARMLIEAEALGCVPEAALAAALLAERDPFERDHGVTTRVTDSDIVDRVEALEVFARSGRLDHACGRLQRESARHLLRAAEQLKRSVDSSPELQTPNRGDALRRAIFAAYPDRLCRVRERQGRRALMVGGRGVKLGPMSGVTESELFVAVDVDAGGVESFVRLASAVKRDELPAEQLVTRREIEFDGEKLHAWKRTRFEDLIIDETPAHWIQDDPAANGMLLNYAKDVRPADDSAAGQLLLRWLCLKKWRPEVELPEVNDAIFAEVLPEVCRGCRSLSEVASADWVGAFRGRLTWEQWQRLEREAPAALDVPSGRSVALQYELGRPPVLAAKIQELFGLAETPRIADGTVKVLVHLLAPNGRPQQVTDDLASFWANTYALVRKDLRGRYPKHDWPENPYEAVASRGVRRRD